jgi:CheY-like chemotaxis protein
MQNSMAISILIVDDNETNRYALSKVLKARGVEVRQAANGTEAREMMKNAPDLVLMDIHLPDIIGYGLLEEFRKSPKTADTPIILMSATEPAPNARSAAMSLGVRSFLTLPVVADDLWVTIQASIYRQKHQAQ